MEDPNIHIDGIYRMTQKHLTDQQLQQKAEELYPYDESNKHNGPIHWEKHRNKIDKYRNTWVAGVKSQTAAEYHKPTTETLIVELEKIRKKLFDKKHFYEAGKIDGAIAEIMNLPPAE